MDAAFSIFVNGFVGVFTGIALLYLMMKVLSAVAGRPPVDSSSNSE